MAVGYKAAEDLTFILCYLQCNCSLLWADSNLMIQPARECEIKSSGSHARPRLALTGYNSSLKYTGSLKTAAGDQGEMPQGHSVASREMVYSTHLARKGGNWILLQSVMRTSSKAQL